MNEAKKIQEQHTAGPQAIGFDYQFYYFMYLALRLGYGEKIGFEVKDDIHIDKQDGTTILFQAKHTVLKNADGSPQNLTTLDSDLWKTLSTWADFVKAGKDNPNFLSQHFFFLITNKSENTNKFIDSLFLFKTDKNIDSVLVSLNELETTDATLKFYIKNLISIGKNKLRLFLSNLTIETNIDGIIDKIKARILENTRQEHLVDAVFDSLSSNLLLAKYTDIKDRKKFEISFDDFNKKFGKCFLVAFKDKPLPKRQFPIILPENLEEQVFIKQLLDIGEIDKNSSKIIDYTRQMLQVMNNLSYWAESNFVLPTEMEDFNRNSIIIWENEFRSKYREIEKQINSGTPFDNLETEIQNLAIGLIDIIRRENLSLAGDTLGIELSNGHYYALSNKPQLGWHFGWGKKYKIV